MTLALLLALSCQDDVAEWVRRLGTDDYDTREAAARHLMGLGPSALDALTRAREQATDPEVRARLDVAIESIRLRSQIEKALGPSRRVSLSARGRPLRDVLKELGEKLGEKLESRDLDLDRPIDLEIKEGTTWEALDGLARSAGAAYEYGEDGTVLRPGSASKGAAIYFEQFRLAVVEVKRVDYRGAGVEGTSGMIVVELRYPRSVDWMLAFFQRPFGDFTVSDSSGGDAKTASPRWISAMSLGGRPFALQSYAHVNPAAGPLTVQGKATVRVPSKVEGIALPLGQEVRHGEFTFRLSGITEAGETLTVGLKTEIAGRPPIDMRARLDRQEIHLVDGKGNRSRGELGCSAHANGIEAETTDWEIRFPRGIDEPKELTIRWVSEFLPIEIPFRFEGIRIPE